MKSLFAALRYRFACTAGALALLAAANTAGAFTIADAPPYLASNLGPNIILTLDDSGSMQRGYVPDTLCSDSTSPPSGSARPNSRRIKSASYNSLYYDPNTRYDPPLDASGNPLTTSFTAAYVNGYATANGTVNLSTDYRATLAYDPSSGTSGNWWNPANNDRDCNAVNDNLWMPAPTGTGQFANGQEGVQAYYYLYDSSVSGCSPVTAASRDNDACYRRVLVSATSGPGNTDERQNFANWYSFYRTRNLLTVAAASRTFQSLPPGSRLAWQALNSCNGSFGSTSKSCRGWQGSSGPNVNSLIRTFDSTHKTSLFTWLFRLPASGGTPLRAAMARAGDYYRTSTASNGNNTPYAETPQVTAGTEFACRPNFHIMMTDGIWNGSGGTCSGATCGNADGTAATLPDGRAYSLNDSRTRIYRDDNSESLSDIAFHYWKTDLRTDLPNKQLPYRGDRTGSLDDQFWNPLNDPATWQHMVNFTIGLGLTSTMNLDSPNRKWIESTFDPRGGYPNFLSGAALWPSTASDASPGNVYDLWHAAINSRGQAFSAENPTQLLNAMRAALDRIGEQRNAAAAVSLTSTQLSNDTFVFQALFDSSDWTGTLRAYQVNTDGSLGALRWTTDTVGMPAPAGRKIVTWSGSSGVDFTRSALETAGLWSLIATTPAAEVPGFSVAAEAEDLLNYTRGDRAKERTTANQLGLYRARPLMLGDIVNSQPAYVGPRDQRYGNLPEGASSSGTPYATFVANKRSKTEMVYVGANDGMLHGFRARTGELVFSYIPRGVLGNLRALSQPSYTHRYYVDGSPNSWDVPLTIGASASWRTVLLGTTGAGGRSIFALDVTDPENFSAGNVLWEINETTPQRTADAVNPDYANDLGRTLGQGTLLKLNSGDWAVLFGNGYGSPNGRAVLYIVRASDGTLLRKIDTGVGSSTTPNGLGTIVPYDSNNDMVYDVAYATDMRGNVWKFDLTGTSPSSWKIAFAAATGFPNGAPFFQARNASGNVQPIQSAVTFARAPAGKTGLMVLFGTGRLFANGDNTDATAQSVYGLWDNGSPITTTDRSQLVRQTLTTNAAGTRRDLTANAVDYATKRGWYIDLPAARERVYGPGRVRDERFILTSAVPSNDPCDFGGSGWLFAIDPWSGGKLTFDAFDGGGSGVAVGGMSPTPAVASGATKDAAATSGASGGDPEIRQINRGPGRGGRDAWREVVR